MLLRMSALPITNSLDWACKLAYKLKSVVQSTRVRYWSCYRPLNVSFVKRNVQSGHRFSWTNQKRCGTFWLFTIYMGKPVGSRFGQMAAGKIAFTACRTTAARAWNWYHLWLWRNVTEIFVWTIPTTGPPFQKFRSSQKFPSGTT